MGYPPTSREAVWTALYSLLNNKLLYNATTNPAGPFITITRRLQMWDQVPAESKPWLCIVDHKESYRTTGRGLPTRRSWRPQLWIYANVEADADSTNCGSVQLNNLLDAVEGVLRPTDGTPLSLGGLVYNAVFEDETHKEPGDLDGFAVSITTFNLTPP